MRGAQRVLGLMRWIRGDSCKDVERDLIASVESILER